MVRTVHHSGVDVFLGSDAVLQNDDSLVDHGEQDAVDHEAGSLADLDGVLAQVLGAAIDSLEGLVVGTGAADDLDQLHSGSGVEEVHAQNLLRTLGSGSDGGDGDGRGVGSQDGLGLADLVQFLEDALLDVQDLDGSLNDQVAVLGVGQLQGEGNAAQGLVLLLLGDLALGNLLLHVLLQNALAALNESISDVADDNGLASLSENLGDAHAHGACTQDHNLIDSHCSFPPENINHKSPGQSEEPLALTGQVQTK